MLIQNNYSLRNYNTFGIEALARYWVELENAEDFQKLILLNEFEKSKKLPMGGGSNILLSSDFDGFVFKLNDKSLIVDDSDPESVFITVGSGFDWDELVKYTVEEGWYGLENLSGIPGCTGACPIQNIGAYGAEVKDTIVNVKGIYIDTGDFFFFDNQQCNFGYRESVFKKNLLGKCLIVSVTFQLKKKGQLNLTYSPIAEAFQDKNGLTPANIREEVLQLRNKKLPDPKIIGNAGSFFKNSAVGNTKLKELVSSYPAIPYFDNKDGSYKIPSAYLIEQCGWKGYRVGDAGVHQNQSLVLVNYGNASGQELIGLAKEIIASVYDKFGIRLEIEVSIV